MGTAEAIAYNVTHPVEAFKDFVAWDDWANGQEDRALGKIVGGLLLGGGAGKLAKSLLRRPGRGGDGDNGDADSGGIKDTISDPRKFDPGTLKGEAPDQVRANIPSDWARSGSKTGGGEVFRVPESMRWEQTS